MENFKQNYSTKIKTSFKTHKAYYELGVIILLLVVIICFYLSQSNNSTPNQVSRPTPTPQPRQTLLYFSPPSLTINSQSQTQEKLNLVIQTNANSIYGADIELSYNPNLITNLHINPGTFILNAESLPTSKNKLGTLSYIIAVPLKAKPVKGTGILAQISFNINKSALQQAKSTQISFQPTTSISGFNQQYSVLNVALSEHITYSQ